MSGERKMNRKFSQALRMSFVSGMWPIDLMRLGGVSLTFFGLYNFDKMLCVAFGGYMLSNVAISLYSVMHLPQQFLNPSVEEQKENSPKTPGHHGEGQYV